MSKKAKRLEVMESSASAVPPEGFRPLTETERLEFENFTLRLANAHERLARWGAEAAVAKQEESKARNEIAALGVLAQKMDEKLGVKDPEKDLVRVNKTIYVRRTEPVLAEAVKPEVTVTPGPTL
jgi:hypothetical protein